MATDNLAPLIVPPPTQAVRYGQGRIVSWDEETFDNVIDWNGVRLENLPVLAGTDALTFNAGQTVGLLGWDAGGQQAEGSWWILGRLVLPGAGQGEAAVQWMTSALATTLVNGIVDELLRSPAGQELAAFVIGQRVHTDIVTFSQSTTSTSYTDLATVGPTVADVEITDAGKALVILSAYMTIGSGPLDQFLGQLMGVQVSGATPISPTRVRSLARSAESSQALDTLGTSKAFVLDGLNPGIHTFRAKYRSEDSAFSMLFADRQLVVIAF